MGVFQLQAKLTVAVLMTTWLLVGDASEAYARHRYGFEKDLAASPGSRKKDEYGGITEDSYGGKNLERDEREVLEEGFRFRMLRSNSRFPSPPPSPFRNKPTSFWTTLSPPPPSNIH